MTTSPPARVSRSLQVQGSLSWLRALSPRSVGIMVLSLAMLMTVATYLLYTSLTYPMILLAPAPLAQAMAAQGAWGSVFGFLCLLISGGLVIVLSVRLAVDLDQPRQRRTSVIGGTAGSLWVVGALVGLLLMLLWGNAPAGLTQTLAILFLVMTEIASPLLLARWTVAQSHQLKAYQVLGWIGAIGFVLSVVCSLLWCLNALMPIVSGFYGVAESLNVLSVIALSFWLLWLLLLGMRLLAQNALGGTREPQSVATGDDAEAMPRRQLLRGALGAGIGLAGAAFVVGRTGFLVGAEPELESDDIPAEPSLIAAGYYLIALVFLKIIHPINSVAALVQQTSPRDTTPPPPAEVSAQLGEEVTIEQITVNGVPAERISAPGASSSRWLLYIHGGGWAVPATNGHRAFVGRLSKALNATVLMPNYRLIPAHPFPAALDDCVAAYRWLRQQGVPASHIAIAGESAGGNLTLTATLALRDSGDELPAVLVPISPPTDMAMTGETYRTKAWADPIAGGGLARDVFDIYTSHRATNLRNPLVSPLYGDVRGFPPTMIQASTQEVFLSDAARMADRLKAARVTTKIEVWPGQLHAFAAGPSIIPEARLATRHIATFIRKYLQG